MDHKDIKRLIDSEMHVVGCHSYSHQRLSDSLSTKTLDKEINQACDSFFRNKNDNIKSFAWVGGEEFSYGKKAFELLNRQNLDYVFATNCEPISRRSNPHNLNRYGASAKNSLNDARLSISSLYTLLYLNKRNRVIKNLGLNRDRH